MPKPAKPQRQSQVASTSTNSQHCTSRSSQRNLHRKLVKSSNRKGSNIIHWRCREGRSCHGSPPTSRNTQNENTTSRRDLTSPLSPMPETPNSVIRQRSTGLRMRIEREEGDMNRRRIRDRARIRDWARERESARGGGEKAREFKKFPAFIYC